MLPSCVPATGLDESGAGLEAEQLRPDVYKRQKYKQYTFVKEAEA